MWRPRFKQVITSYQFQICRKSYSRYIVEVNPDEYTDVPVYPPIEDLSFHARLKRKELKWHEKIKSIKTVEEKLFQLNIKYYYGHRCLVLTEHEIPYDALSFAQFATRTHLEEVETLPNFYSTFNDPPVEVVNSVKSSVEDAIAFQVCDLRRKNDIEVLEDNYLTPEDKDNIIMSALVNQINNIALTNLSPLYPHLLQCQVDYKPRVEAFWCLGGLPPPRPIRRKRERIRWMKVAGIVDDPVDRYMQYKGSPVLSLRHELPLPPIVNHINSEDLELCVPSFDYDPLTIGFMNYEYRNGTNIPGYWPGDPCEFGQLSFHPRSHMVSRNPDYGERENINALHYQGILASFGSTFSQACYQGFNGFNDITYPLTSQVIITNGRLWSFYVYQLNTTLLWGDNARNNEHTNICWATKPVALYEDVEDGKVIGFNEDVLKTLLKFYTNTPQRRTDTEMKPYLDQTTQYVADYEDKDRREWWETYFKYMYSNRPRQILRPEIYDWEKIYKVWFQTRHMDKKTRFFEIPEPSPFKRRYDDHPAKFIRKYDRVGVIKGPRAVKWEKLFHN